jgi:hypothetical protein
MPCTRSTRTELRPQGGAPARPRCERSLASAPIGVLFRLKTARQCLRRDGARRDDAHAVEVSICVDLRPRWLSPQVTVAGEEGFEPAPHGFGDRCSDLLSYTPMLSCPTKNRPCRLSGGRFLSQDAESYPGTTSRVMVQLSSGSGMAAKRWTYHPRACCLLDDLLTMTPSLCARPWLATCLSVCPGLAPRTAIHLVADLRQSHPGLLPRYYPRLTGVKPVRREILPARNRWSGRRSPPRRGRRPAPCAPTGA